MTVDSSIHFKHVLMGTTPGWGGGARLARLVGPRVAARLLARGQPLTATEALQIGLCDDVVPTDDPEGGLEAFIDGYRHDNIAVVRAAKEVAFAPTRCRSPEEAVALEQSVFARFWGSAANRDAVAKGVRK